MTRIFLRDLRESISEILKFAKFEFEKVKEAVKSVREILLLKS